MNFITPEADETVVVDEKETAPSVIDHVPLPIDSVQVPAVVNDGTLTLLLFPFNVPAVRVKVLPVANVNPSCKVIPAPFIPILKSIVLPLVVIFCATLPLKDVVLEVALIVIPDEITKWP